MLSHSDGNKRLIAGLIWTLILRFEINRGGNDDLLKWVQSKIPQQNITGWTGKGVASILLNIEVFFRLVVNLILSNRLEFWCCCVCPDKRRPGRCLP